MTDDGASTFPDDGAVGLADHGAVALARLAALAAHFIEPARVALLRRRGKRARAIAQRAASRRERPDARKG